MTIAEITDSFDRAQRGQLLSLIMKDGVSTSTAYMWSTGRRTPMLLYQQRIQGYIRKITGTEYPLAELFPQKGGQP